jgi:hypothetical protein
MEPWAIGVLVATVVIALVLIANACVGFFLGDR